MASFKTHIKIGSFVAFFVTIGSYIMDWTSNFAMAILVFFTTTIGSFLPDMDSDSGLPIQIIFGLYAYFAAGITFYFIWNSNLPGFLALVAPVAAYLLVIYAVRPWFKKQTAHRGIFHSTPAVLISFFATLFIVSFFRITLYEKFVFSAALAIGYLTHLVLDEFYSVNLMKGKIKVAKSLGSAVDLGFSNKRTAIAAYLLLALLIFLTYPIILKLYKNLL